MLVIFSLLLLNEPLVQGIADNTCVREKVAGSVFKLTGGYDPKVLTSLMCMEACADLNDLEVDVAGMTAGQICLCGKLGKLSSMTNPTDHFAIIQPQN